MGVTVFTPVGTGQGEEECGLTAQLLKLLALLFSWFSVGPEGQE